MASTQEKMQTAEAAAKMAATELVDVNRETNKRQYAEEREAAKMDQSDQDRPRDNDQDEKRGVLGSVLKSVAETLEQTVTGKGPGTSKDDQTRSEDGGYQFQPTQKAEETKEETKEKVEDSEKSVAEKAREAKEKAGDYKDSAAEKLEETKESASEKVREATGTNKSGRDDDQLRHEDPSRYNNQEGLRPGVIGSLLKSVTESLKQANEVVTAGKSDKTPEDRTREGDSVGPTEKATEVGEKAKVKLEETKNSAVENTRGYKDYTKEKVEETKNSVAEQAKEKVGEYKDYAAEKAKETKDSTVGKVRDYKDSAEEHGKEAKDTAAEKAKEAKEMTEEKAGEYKDYASETVKEAKDKTGKKAMEYKDYTAEKSKETEDTAAGKIGELQKTVVDNAKKAVEFLTGRREESGDENKDKFGGTEDAETRQSMKALSLQEEDMVLDVEGAPGRQAAATNKDADETTGQT